jgi:RimJ/RimL family protein N-acetyltransferase
MEPADRPPGRAGSPPESPRLALRPLPWTAVRAMAEGSRLDGWAADYPAEGDLLIAGLLHGAGPAAWAEDDGRWGHQQVVERATGLVVGGIGFHGPPDGGAVEIGYGIVPSRQGRGYATEAVRLMVAMAWARPAVTAVTASTDLGNVASQRVLEKAGFRRLPATGEVRYRLARPS